MLFSERIQNDVEYKMLLKYAEKRRTLQTTKNMKKKGKRIILICIQQNIIMHNNNSKNYKSKHIEIKI